MKMKRENLISMFTRPLDLRKERGEARSHMENAWRTWSTAFIFIQILYSFKNIGLDLLLTTWLSSCDREIPDAYFPICGGKNQMPPKENGMSLNNEWFDKWLSKS